jgi:hypothetical protein
VDSINLSIDTVQLFPLDNMIMNMCTLKGSDDDV